MKKQLLSWKEILLVVLLFFVVGYFSQRYLETLQGFIDSRWGMLLYILLLMVAVVIAPLNATPLVPIAALLWGWFWAALLSIVGWTLGSLVAFFIARRYGVALLQKFFSLEKLEAYEKLIPQENLFWGVVFLRMTVPVDLLSYALGLFSTLSFKKYFFATLLGVAPFAFVLAYVGRLPLFYQLMALSTGLLLLLLGIVVALEQKKRRKAIISSSRRRKK